MDRLPPPTADFDLQLFSDPWRIVVSVGDSIVGSASLLPILPICLTPVESREVYQSSSLSQQQQQQQSQSQQTASGSGYIKTLESQVQTLLTGLGKELKALEQHEVDLKAIVVVHTDRAKARHTSHNETGTLISLRRIHRTNQELQQLHQGMHYLQEERTKIQALLQECESVRTNNDKKKKLLQSVLQVKLSDHVAKVKQLLAVSSTSSFSSIDENTPPSSPEAEQDEVSDEELLKQFASSLQEAAAERAAASQ